MRKILFSRWLLSFVGTAIFVALVWIFGPFLSLLEPIAPRAVIGAVLTLIWVGANACLDWRQRARDKALAEGAVATDPGAVASAEEAAEMKDRLRRALELLRKGRGKRGWLYQQPWYVIIGPPGAGKTTALLNSGLHFPLAEEMGQDVVPGVGGTRLCDWWFTDDAVLIDTAGRYTTQDSDAAVDRAGWETFLDLLKRTRLRQPLNGVIVAISLSDIAQGSREESMAHAAAIRRRLNELGDRLGVRLPVYAMFTKADLIAGFSEFFDDMDREKRAQVWGMTFPLDKVETGSAQRFGEAFSALVARLDSRLLDRLQAERSPDRRALIAGFPAQVASLAAPLGAFLEAAFTGSRLAPAPMLRGVYLNSGTQEGTPIDRLTGVLSRGFGIDQRRAPSLRPAHGRSYFLAHLLRTVILGEAILVSEPVESARRRRIGLTAGYAALAVAVLVGGVATWQAAQSNQTDIDRFSTALDAYTKAAPRISPDRVTDGDLAAIVPLLDQARDLPFRTASGSDLGLGLSQQGKLGSAGQAVYRNALNDILLPRLIVRLEGQMRAAMDRPDFLYQATRVYLMLAGQGPLDRDLVTTWMRLDWDQTIPDAAMRADLLGHLTVLLAQPLPQVGLDGALVDAARVTFSRVTVAQRVYARIVDSAAAQALAPWRPADALGEAGAQLFVRGSGKALTDGIPGLYTVQRFKTILLPSVPQAAKQVASESWVLGKQSEIDVSAPALASLQTSVVQLYDAEAIKRWDALLADLTLAPQHSAQKAAEALYVLGSPQSPIRGLLAGVVHEVNLTAAAVPAPASTGAAAELKRVLAPSAMAATELAGQPVTDHFKPLLDYVGQGTGAPIDGALGAINAVQQSLAQLAAATPEAPPVPQAADPILTVRAAATQAPQPVQRWLLSIATNAAALRAGGAKQQAAAAFNGAGGPGALCAQAVNGHYPFAAGSGADIPLDDFTRLFAPNGLIDGYFNAQLRPFVDTTAAVWRAQDAGGISAPVSAAELVQFQRAANIRQMFFPAAGSALGVRLEITPVDLDPGSKQVTLDLGSGSVSYAHGPVRASQIAWPAEGASSARVVFDPPAAGGAIQASGPWALFRLIAQGHPQQDGAPDHYKLVFQQGERRAVFSVLAASVINPLIPGALREFRCPALH
jgi:type VI secretion system protein ImpL